MVSMALLGLNVSVDRVDVPQILLRSESHERVSGARRGRLCWRPSGEDITRSSDVPRRRAQPGSIRPARRTRAAGGFTVLVEMCSPWPRHSSNESSPTRATARTACGQVGILLKLLRRSGATLDPEEDECVRLWTDEKGQARLFGGLPPLTKRRRPSML